MRIGQRGRKWLKLSVNDILNRHVITITPTCTLAEAAGLMRERRISSLLIAEENRPIGILTEADLVKVAHLKLDPQHATVGELTLREIVAVDRNLAVDDAFQFLLEREIRHLIVLHPDGALEGVVTLTDMLNAADFSDFLKARLVSDIMVREIVMAAPASSLDDAIASWPLCISPAWLQWPKPAWRALSPNAMWLP